MKPSSYLLHILNVRPSEWKLVKRLFLYQFFQGAGLAFFFTSAFAMFLDRFHIEELPVVMIYSSVLLWGAGFVYSKLETRMKITTLARYLTVFMAVSFLVFRLGVFVFPPSFLYWMLAWFNVLYLLNNLEFWGIASLLFDVRQSKRLFGLISAGDIPAKFIGYTLALLTVGYIGTANLIWAGFVCMLASLPSLLNIEKSEGHINHHHKQHHHEPVNLPNAAHPVTRLIRDFTENVLIRRIAIITVIASATFMIVNFAFYAKVKESVHSDVQLAQFIAFFFAVARVVALFVKVIFTGRLINRLGIIRSLMITPVLMILLVLGVILTQQSILTNAGTIYMFGAMAIVVDILRSINTPVFLTLMQPLSTHERLRAHTITKGIMDPFASLFSGLLLLGIIRFEHDVHLPSLNYILVILGVLWIVGIYRIHQEYLHTLLKTISNRFFHNSEFSVTDPTALEWLKEKLSRGTETEARNILKMLSERQEPHVNTIILQALDHPSDQIKTLAIRLSSQRSIQHSEEKLRTILFSGADPELKAEVIKALCKINMDEKEVLDFIDNEHPMVQQAAITGLLQHGKLEDRGITLDYFHTLVHSEDVSLRKNAAIILKELRDPHYKPDLITLLRDPDPGVSFEAYIAAGKTGDEELLQTVINQLDHHEKYVLESLYTAGEQALPVIESFIFSRKCTHWQLEKLIRLIGNIGGEKAHLLLLELLNHFYDNAQLIIKTLYLSNFKAHQKYHHFFEVQIRGYLSYCAGILYMQKLLAPNERKYHVLIHSLELELNNARDTLLFIFSLMYDREKIKDVRAAFRSGKKEAIANAMEIIEMTVKKETANYFNTIFETSDLDHKVYSLRKLFLSGFFTNVENILITILQQEIYGYENWTKACSLYTSKKQQVPVTKDLITRYVGAEHPLLREVARFAIYEIKTV